MTATARNLALVAVAIALFAAISLSYSRYRSRPPSRHPEAHAYLTQVLGALKSTDDPTPSIAELESSGFIGTRPAGFSAQVLPASDFRVICTFQQGGRHVLCAISDSGKIDSWPMGEIPDELSELLR